jgi:hypothetical protein
LPHTIAPSQRDDVKIATGGAQRNPWTAIQNAIRVL